MTVPLAVRLAGSSRHRPLPPIRPICPAAPASAGALTVQVNDALPVPPRASEAEMATLNVPHLVGQPVIRPAEFIDRPVGRPVAVSAGLTPAFSWSGPVVVTRCQTGVPAFDVMAGADTATAPAHPEVDHHRGGNHRRGGGGAGRGAGVVWVKATEYVPTEQTTS